MTLRESLHREPANLGDFARHYLRDVVYGAIDGIVTTFAVVAGVTGGDLSARAVLVVGIANLFADGLSMGVGNYLSIRSHESMRAAQALPEEEASPARHGLATWAAFATAGAVPLAPYLWGASGAEAFYAASALTLITLFAVGASRTVITIDRWWTAGLEMTALGAAVAAAAYGAGFVVGGLVGG
jgi:VIT1/CCC1 family predicted Fe2+/Mn2+ transporter